LILKIVVPLPSGRSDIKQIQAHRWCNTSFDKLGSPDRNIYSARDGQSNKRTCHGSEVSSVSAPDAAYYGCALDNSMARLCRSQPELKLQQPEVSVRSVDATVLEEKVSVYFVEEGGGDPESISSAHWLVAPSSSGGGAIGKGIKNIYIYTVELGFNNIGYCDTSRIVSKTQWYKLIPHKATVFIPRLVRHSQMHRPHI
jgi:hypothetical protein